MAVLGGEIECGSAGADVEDVVVCGHGGSWVRIEGEKERDAL